MSSAPPLEVTVVYSRSSRGRRGKYVSSGSTGANFVKIGLANLLVAGALYYGTWWTADPNIQVKILMHTEFAGVNSEDLVNQAIPERTDPAKPASRRAPKAVAGKPQTVQGLTTKGKVYGASLFGWEALSTLSMAALALSSGVILRRSNAGGLRIFGALAATGIICAAALKIYALWTRYGGFVPDELRYGCGALVAAALLFGLLFAHKARRLTLIAGALLILSAGGTVWALHIAATSNAIDPKFATPVYLAAAFAIHSFWGWMLIPIATRLPR